jgi:hypothetical protein
MASDKVFNTILHILEIVDVQYTKTRKRPHNFSYHSSFNILFTDLFTFLEIRGENRLLCLFNRQLAG